MVLSREPVATQFGERTYKQLMPRLCIVITDLTNLIFEEVDEIVSNVN